MKGHVRSTGQTCIEISEAASGVGGGGTFRPQRRTQGMLGERRKNERVFGMEMHFKI